MSSHVHTSISESKSALGGAVPELEKSLAIAQFLHDNVSSNLVVIKMKVCNLYNHAKSGSQKRELKLIGDVVNQLIESIRQASSGLRDEKVQTSSLYESIEDCVRKFQVCTLIRTFVTISGNDPDISSKASVTVMAILQEALANVVRHAQASRVYVQAAQKKGFLTLSVRDNGTGISKSVLKNRDGFGLFSMRQRVAECGGDVDFRSEQGRGFEVFVRIPLRDREEVTAPAQVRHIANAARESRTCISGSPAPQSGGCLRDRMQHSH